MGVKLPALQALVEAMQREAAPMSRVGYYADELAALLAEAERPAVDWQPMGTAPMERILAIANGVRRIVNPSVTNEGVLWLCEASGAYVVPTAWWPMPDLPKVDAPAAPKGDPQ